MFALLQVLKVEKKIALEQKLKVHWNGVQKTFLYTSKSEQAENSLVLPRWASMSQYFDNLMLYGWKCEMDWIHIYIIPARIMCKRMN